MKHITTFVVSGEYGCVLLSSKRSRLAPLTEAIASDRAWRRDIKQVDESAFWYGFGADVVSVPISIYEAGASTKLPEGAQRTLEASFVSRGERVYLHGLTSDDFREWSPSFYLGCGRFRVVCFAWALSQESLDAGDYLPDLLRQERHDLVFIPA
jgi:hypothetical protein